MVTAAGDEPDLRIGLPEVGFKGQRETGVGLVYVEILACGAEPTGGQSEHDQ